MCVCSFLVHLQCITTNFVLLVSYVQNHQFFFFFLLLCRVFKVFLAHKNCLTMKNMGKDEGGGEEERGGAGKGKRIFLPSARKWLSFFSLSLSPLFFKGGGRKWNLFSSQLSSSSSFFEVQRDSNTFLFIT